MNYNEEGALFVEQVKVATCMAGNRKTKSNIAGFLLKNMKMVFNDALPWYSNHH